MLRITTSVLSGFNVSVCAPFVYLTELNGVRRILRIRHLGQVISNFGLNAQMNADTQRPQRPVPSKATVNSGNPMPAAASEIPLRNVSRLDNERSTGISIA